MLTSFNWVESITGSPIFLVLIGLSVITFGVAMERAIYYWKRRGNPDSVFQEALRKIGAGATEEASWACRATAHPMGSAAMEVFQNIGRGEAALEERLQITLSQEKLLLERNLGLLGTMAAVAPLIGLLGTVWGIMRAFHDMSLAGSAAPSVVAAGVAEALTTTAAGLIIAVPAVLLYNHFSRQMNVMLTVAENHARGLRSALTDTGRPAMTATPPAHRQAA